MTCSPTWRLSSPVWRRPIRCRSGPIWSWASALPPSTPARRSRSARLRNVNATLRELRHSRRLFRLTRPAIAVADDFDFLRRDETAPHDRLDRGDEGLDLLLAVDDL